MRKLIIGTTILLLIQLALVVAGQVGKKDMMSATPESPLLAIAGDQVTSLAILGPKGEKLQLEKKGARWVLPDKFGAPADDRQVRSLLDKLTQLKQGFVVASSAEAAKRFKVADDDFERRLVIQEKDTVSGEVLVGTSPAFRQVHARLKDSRDIFAVNLSSYELETAADKWLDKQVLQVAGKDLAGIDIAGISLKSEKEQDKKATSWKLGESSGGTLDTKAAAELAEAVSRLIVLDVVDPKDHAKLAFDQPAMAFTVHTADNRTLEYAFAAIDDNFFAVKRSDSDLVYRTSKAEVDNLRQFSRDRLLGINPAPAAVPLSPSGPVSQPANGSAPAAPLQPVPAPGN